MPNLYVVCFFYMVIVFLLLTLLTLMRYLGTRWCLAVTAACTIETTVISYSAVYLTWDRLTGEECWLWCRLVIIHVTLIGCWIERRWDIEVLCLWHLSRVPRVCLHCLVQVSLRAWLQCDFNVSFLKHRCSLRSYSCAQRTRSTLN